MMTKCVRIDIFTTLNFESKNRDRLGSHGD